ncbi:hypothetical protein [Rouxiella sp. WC2420]|uniref:Uncharacterized protein n=1 Tax=Rouxiella sp. WC2420 TaxID=3234145 RepID=A0AB39VPQ6_9GAMM
MPASYINKNMSSEIFNAKKEQKYNPAKIEYPALKFRTDPWAQAMLLLYTQGAMCLDFTSNHRAIRNDIKPPSSNTFNLHNTLTLLTENKTNEIVGATHNLAGIIQETHEGLLQHVDSTIASFGKSVRSVVAHSTGPAALFNGSEAKPVMSMNFFELPHHLLPARKSKKGKSRITTALPSSEVTRPSIATPLPTQNTTSIINGFFNSGNNKTNIDLVANKAINMAVSKFSKSLSAMDHPVLHLGTWINERINRIVIEEGGDHNSINGNLAIKTRLPARRIDTSMNISKKVKSHTLIEILTKE